MCFVQFYFIHSFTCITAKCFCEIVSICHRLLLVTGNKRVLNGTTMQTKKEKPHEPKWKDTRKYCTACTVILKRALSNQFSVIFDYFVAWFLKLPKINNPSFTWLPVVWKQFRKSEIETQISSLKFGPSLWKSVFLQFLSEWAHVYIVNGTSTWHCCQWCSVIHHQTLNNVC